MTVKRTRNSKSRPRSQAIIAPAEKTDSIETAQTKTLENLGFVIDIFLDEQKNVRLTQVLQVQSGEGEEWEGWDEKRLLGFLLDRSGRRPEAAEAIHLEARNAAYYDAVLLKSVEITPSADQFTANIVRNGEPFTVSLAFSLGDILKSSSAQMNYVASILARKYGEPERRLVAIERGTINPIDEKLTLNVEKPDLQPGLYKIEASLEINPLSDCRAAAKTRIALQVY